MYNLFIFFALFELFSWIETSPYLLLLYLYIIHYQVCNITNRSGAQSVQTLISITVPLPTPIVDTPADQFLHRNAIDLLSFEERIFLKNVSNVCN